MIYPFVTGMTWKVLDWLHAATKLPIAVKGIVTGADAHSAVERGAQAVIVSNHGGRTLDGMIPTLYALPEVVAAVNGRVPVLMDGGIRRGSDIIKAMSSGAKAVLIGRPYYWGLAAFGQVGVQRVIEMLHGEMMVAMGQSGIPNLAAFDRSLVEFLPGTRTVEVIIFRSNESTNLQGQMWKCSVLPICWNIRSIEVSAIYSIDVSH
jgi:isopentenyl diphosphate isomerase/L-lactate dehydrogenase-like FMN-dependent dehydrogenase